MDKFLPVCETMLAGNELKYITDAVSSGWISSSGTYVQRFEEAFAAFCGTKYGIAVCNGTVALHLALVALGIHADDEVIIPDFTMIASALAVCYTGATPIFVDADHDTWNIAPAAIEKKITSHTKAIMAVHIFGNPCDMDALAAIASRHNLFLLEDAAEAHGAEWHGRKAGNLSHIAAFSFFANKNLTTGEGGMVLTNDKQLADACRYYKNVCFPPDAPRTYLHNDLGFNYRMSNLHAAIGLAQTEKAATYIALRRQHARMYRERLATIPGIVLQHLQGTPACWMNGLALAPEYGHSRAGLVAFLKSRNIDTRLFFNGMHRQPALRKYGCACTGTFPVSDSLADNGFYLPSSSTLTEADIDRVCNAIAEYAEKEES